MCSSSHSFSLQCMTSHQTGLACWSFKAGHTCMQPPCMWWPTGIAHGKIIQYMFVFSCSTCWCQLASMVDLVSQCDLLHCSACSKCSILVPACAFRQACLNAHHVFYLHVQPCSPEPTCLSLSSCKMTQRTAIMTRHPHLGKPIPSPATPMTA